MLWLCWAGLLARALRFPASGCIFCYLFFYHQMVVVAGVMDVVVVVVVVG
jgi:hypothetical protein